MDFLKANALGLNTLLLAIAGGFCGCAGTPAPSSTVIWKVDNLASVGGSKPEVLGAPRAENSSTGKALVFDGAKDGLILPANPIAGCKEFTIEVLFAPAMNGPAEQRFFHIQDTAGRRVLMELRMTPASQWSLDTFLLDGTSSKALHDYALAHPAGRWYWVALRYDGKTLSSFVDGQPQLTGDVAFTPMVEGQTSLGVRLNKVSWFKGAIGEVRFTPTALPPAELQRVGNP